MKRRLQLTPHRLLMLALWGFYLGAYLLPLGCREMFRPDEFRYAEVPREMLRSGDWVSPRLVGFRYFEKPALGYQLVAASFRLFGENAFALRLPFALATGLTALMLYALVRRWDRRSEAAALSVLAAIRSATASAWVRSSLPLRKARLVNSPGSAGLAPALRISPSSRPGAKEPP